MQKFEFKTRLYFAFFIENVEYLHGMQFLEFKTRLYFDFFIENVEYLQQQ